MLKFVAKKEKDSLRKCDWWNLAVRRTTNTQTRRKSTNNRHSNATQQNKMVEFRPWQVTLLQWLHCSGGILSICGSTCIFCHIIAGKKTKHVYHRLLLGISVVDIVTSINYTLASQLTHKPHRLPSLSCTIEGFVTVLGTASPLYSAALSLYFLLRIRYAVPDQTLANRIEPLLHITCLLYPVAMGVAALSLKALNPNYPYGLGCWTSKYPVGCDDRDDTTAATSSSITGTTTVPCERGEGSGVLGWFATVLPLAVALSMLIVNNILIYMTIRSLVPRQKRGNGQFRNQSLQNLFRSQTQTELERPARDDQRHGYDEEEEENRCDNDDDERVDVGQSSTNNTIGQPQENPRDDINGHSNNAERVQRAENTTSQQPQQIQDLRHASLGSIPGRGSTEPSAAAIQRTKLVAGQSFLYVVAFVVVYLCSGALYGVRVQQANVKDFYWLLALHVFFWPLQGFANFFVYFRPRYIRWRSVLDSRLAAFCKAAFSLDSPANGPRGSSLHRSKSSKGGESMEVCMDENDVYLEDDLVDADI